MATVAPAPQALMVGTGEYTTGLGSTSDKGAGVVGIVFFDLRRRGKLGSLFMSGRNGMRFPAIRDHFKKRIEDVYSGMDVSFNSFPEDDCQKNETAYIDAMDALSPGDLVTIFTPDDTHFEIAMAAVKRGLHVLVTKPSVKTLDDHMKLVKAAREHNVLVAVEVHKRWDPIYSDARDRILQLGDFSFFQSYMSQPKKQLSTFAAWAGKSSDISYYLNSHHIDFHAWACGNRFKPTRVTASGSRGIASSEEYGGIDTEDTITLMVQWESRTDPKSMGTALYTSSWVAPPSDVHSQQRFFYMGSKGEVNVDQAHRGFQVSTDAQGYASCNPLFMKYMPNGDGEFAGQLGYGYRSFEVFVDAVTEIRNGRAQPQDFRTKLCTIDGDAAVWNTAILEAGRCSLDLGGASIIIKHGDEGSVSLETQK